MGRSVDKNFEVGVCILAGGASRRFGGNKAFANLHGKPLLEHVLDRIRAQTTGPLIINANDPEQYARFGLKVISDDQWPEAGPLVGVYAAMSWARDVGLDQVVTVAVDQPHLPMDFVATLLRTGAPAIAASHGRPHPVNALWPANDLAALHGYLASGKRSVFGWAEICQARIAEFQASPDAVDPFLNVNTPDDLRAAEQASVAHRTEIGPP